MGLTFAFEPNGSQGDFDFTVNGVSLGAVNIIQNQVSWFSGLQPECVKFSIKDENRLDEILSALISFKDENNYDDVIIGNYRGHVGTFFSEEVWNRHGFELADNPGYYRMKK